VSDAKLVFVRPADGTGRLIFGDDSDTNAPAAGIGADGGFADETDGALGGYVRFLWSANVVRGERAQAAVRWQDGAPAITRAESHWQDAAPASARAAPRWQAGAAAAGRTAARWQQSRPISGRTAQHWQDGEALRLAALARWQEAVRLRAGAAQRWQDGEALRLAMDLRYQEAIRLRLASGSAWQDARPRTARVVHRAGDGQPVRRAMATRWQDARRPPPGASSVVQPPPPPPELCYDPATLGQAEFLEPWANSGRLVFVCFRAEPGPAATLYILPSRYYMAVHSLTCHRLPGMEPVPISGVTLDAAQGSFGWTFSAPAMSGVYEQLASTSEAPTQVLIQLDGMSFVFALDEPEGDDAWLKRSVSISGRSVTSSLAQPYARETARLNTAAATAQQLALQALEFTGVGLDWGLTDWLVPAGGWSHLGTPLAAVQTIVEAAGGYLLSHRSAPTLLARHPYPDLPGGGIGAPWYWSNPAIAADVELAPDAVMVTNRRRVWGPNINGVWISGTTANGIQALYRRDGTAGDRLGKPVTDALIVAEQVARQRGRAVVGAANLKELVTLELPVYTGPNQPGIIDVGALLQINSAVPWRGRVRSVSVSAPFGQAVRQRLQVERHLEVTA
jgi:hypothetical protein